MIIQYFGTYKYGLRLFLLNQGNNEHKIQDSGNTEE